MGRVWSDANKYSKWLEVELAATETLAESGEVPKDAAATIRARAKVDAVRISEIESRVKHDVIAFTMNVGESIGDPAAARWLHYGMTSNDVVDTAQALLVRDASRLIAATICARAKVDAGRISGIESRVKHDVIAFTMNVGESIGDPAAARWLHYGMTSNDVVDTAQALLVRDASRLIAAALVKFGEVLARRAQQFRNTPQIGRTHGIHAEPITFGLKIANWYAENQRNIERFEDAAAQMRVGKLSGAVGNASHLGPEMEERICQRLSLNVAPVASQVIQRDRHAHYLSTLAIIAATLEKIAVEIRHLQRTEVREAEEPFGGEQRGSSAMPHKRNPVVCEQVSGLARLVRSNMVAAFENIGLWHERDISHSSVERVILPDSTILIDYMLAKMTTVIADMRVFPERMMRNLNATQGLV